MKLITVYARFFGECFLDALAGLSKNLWTLLLPPALLFVFYLVGLLLPDNPWIGGIVMSLLRSALMSVYCYVLAAVVAKSKVGAADLRQSLGAYFWSWLNLFFLLWIVDLIIGTVLGNNPQRALVFQLVGAMQLVVLNAAPETIYLKGTLGGIDTMTRSFKFLQENWIEWFLINGLFIAAVVLLAQQVSLGMVGVAVLLLLGGAALHVIMLFRGHLYQALDSSTHRQRMFRYRTPS